MNTTTNKALPLVTALFNAIDSHQTIVDSLNPSYETRASALKAIKDTGYTSVQDGRSKKPALACEIPFNDALKAFFATRFEAVYKTSQVRANDTLKLNGKTSLEYKAPTKEQISNDLAQQVRNLNYYLKTGTFVTNVGRDKAKNEVLELTAALHAAERKEEATKMKAAKEKADLAALLVKQEADKQAAILESAELEAEIMLLEEHVKETATQAAINPTKENKLAADKAQADKRASDKAQADKAQADKRASDKAQADKAAQVKQALTDKAHADKATADKLAAQKALDDKKAGKKQLDTVSNGTAKINFNAKFTPEIEKVAEAFILQHMTGLSVALKVCVGRKLLAEFETTA